MIRNRYRGAVRTDKNLEDGAFWYCVHLCRLVWRLKDYLSVFDKLIAIRIEKDYNDMGVIAQIWNP